MNKTNVYIDSIINNINTTGTLNKTLDLVKSHGIILLVSGLFIATAIYIFIYYIKPQIDKSYYTNDEFNDTDTKNK